MRPAEEQMLRNQLATLELLSQLMGGEANINVAQQIKALINGLNCMKETELLLKTEHQQGHTVHDYTP